MGSPTVLGVEPLRSLLDAVSAYLSHNDQNKGDDYFKAESRRVRMNLDDAIDALQPCDVPKLLAIGRAQGLREAAGIAEERGRVCASRNEAHYYDCRQDEADDAVTEIERVVDEITAAAEKAERGDG